MIINNNNNDNNNNNILSVARVKPVPRRCINPSGTSTICSDGQHEGSWRETARLTDSPGKSNRGRLDGAKQ